MHNLNKNKKPTVDLKKAVRTAEDIIYFFIECNYCMRQGLLYLIYTFQRLWKMGEHATAGANAEPKYPVPYRYDGAIRQYPRKRNYKNAGPVNSTRRLRLLPSYIGGAHRLYA